MIKLNKKENSGIGNIKYGEIHSYYPIKFDTKFEFSRICQQIEKSSILFSKEYEKKILNSLQKSMSKSVEEIKKDNIISSKFKLEVSNDDKHPYSKESTIPLEDSDITIEIGIYDDSFKLEFKYDELENLYQRFERLQKEFELSKQIYGDIFVSEQQRYILLPCKIKLNNNQIVWLNCILYVFANNMGILKLELPLVDVDIEPLKNNNSDLYIKEIINKWNISDLSSASTLSELVNVYIKTLLNINTDIIKYNNQINHFIFTNFEGLPKNINSIPDNIQEDLYSIISAPLPQREGISHKNAAKEHLRNYSWGNQDMKYIIKTTGGCLSIIDQTLLFDIIDKFKSNYEVSELESTDYRYIYELITRDISVNAEFALIIIILKRMNDSDYYFRKKNSTSNIFKIKEDYYRNVIFINELQEGCYGSVTEQTIAFENMMPHYLKKEITKSKAIALDKILEQQKQKKIDEFQNFLTTGGLILSILFGLPAIKDTFLIIRNSLYSIPRDIAYISLDGLSLIIWILINLTIVYKILSSKEY